MTNEKLYKAFKFFLAHAGYRTPPGRASCALNLARAELRAEEIGITREREEYNRGEARIFVEWDYDTDGLMNRDVQEGCEVLGCAVHVDGEVLASCGGIEMFAPSFVGGQPRDPYIRVMQAELLSEALYILDQRKGTAEIKRCDNAA